jgi:hypothetical protein
VYRNILGPVSDNGKENWRILTNNEIYAMVKKPTITETISLILFVGMGIHRERKKTKFP